MTTFGFQNVRTLGLVASLFSIAGGLTGCPAEDATTAGSGGSGAGGGATTAGGSGGGSTGGASTGGGGAGGSVATTHGGLISIQDMSIHGAPQAGHGLTIQMVFTAARAPDYEETPGAPTGCKGWVYDMATAPPPAPTDQGAIAISGLGDTPLQCHFEPGAGYRCPVSSGSGAASVSPGAQGIASFVVPSASFTQADVGKYLKVSGAATASNNGAFAVVGVLSSSTALLHHPKATVEDFAAQYALIAGAGPVPNNPNDPIVRGDALTVGINPGGGLAFDFPDAGPIVAGESFVLDEPTKMLLGAIPLDGSSFALSCAGQGGSCGAAQATVVRLTTTDASTAGLSPFALPAPVAKQVDILCATIGGEGTVIVPAAAMSLLAGAHQTSPITRIRTAFMREGLAVAQSPEPLAPNPVRILAGHGMLGFVNP